MDDTNARMTRVTIRVTLSARDRLKMWARRAGLSTHAYMKQSLLLGSKLLAQDMGIYKESDTIQDEFTD